MHTRCLVGVWYGTELLDHSAGVVNVPDWVDDSDDLFVPPPASGVTTMHL
jgi:hypothetical protein